MVIVILYTSYWTRLPERMPGFGCMDTLYTDRQFNLYVAATSACYVITDELITWM